MPVVQSHLYADSPDHIQMMGNQYSPDPSSGMRRHHKHHSASSKEKPTPVESKHETVSQSSRKSWEEDLDSHQMVSVSASRKKSRFGKNLEPTSPGIDVNKYS